MGRLLNVFDIVPGWIYALAIAALLATGGTLLAAEKGKLALEERDHAQTKALFADYQKRVSDRETQRATAAVAAVESNRELERNRNRAAQEAMNELVAETARTAASRAASAERERMRDQLIDTAARSASGGQGGADSAALRRAEETAATLGGLLKACRAEGRSDGAEFEELAAQLRSVITQYESLTKSRSPATAGSQ